MYKLAHFILQNFKKFLDTIQSYEDVPFLGSKQPISLEQNFFGTNLYCFHLPIGTFHCANILKNSFRGSRDLRMHHFWARNGPFAPNKNIFGKLLLFSSTYQPLSLCKILKIFFQRIQSYEDVQFLSPKWPIFPNEIFFRKHLDEPSFFHSCLST